MYLFKNIPSFHKDIDEEVITCTEVVQQYLFNIVQKKKLNAFTEVYAEEAITRAQLLDAKHKSGIKKGKLYGVVIAIKDVISFAGHSLTAASKILSGFKAVYHATAIEKLLAEDAIIIGCCNCDEFAMGSTNENSYYGKVLNALDESRVPGGSSGGSAVAVQAGLCMASLGSDTGGSVRQPADFCGIIGLKPTYGSISRYGLIAYASSFDQIGIFGKTSEDVAMLLETISGNDEYDSTASSVPVENYFDELNKNSIKKIAYLKPAFEHEALDEEMRQQFEKFFNKLKNDGFEIHPVDFEYLDYIVPAYYILTTAEASSNLQRYDGVRYGYRSKEKELSLIDFYKKNRSEGFGKEVKRRIMLGTFVLSSGYYDAYFSKAQQVRRLLVEKAESIFKTYDALLMPTVPSPAFKAGEKINDPIAMYLADIFTVFANLVGLPAISIPLFHHQQTQMPFGMQVLTNRFEEKKLLQISKQWMDG